MTFTNRVDTTRIATRAREGANRGLRLGGEHVLGQARAHVPIEEATLERSGRVSTDTTRLAAAVCFDTPYAVVQHEDLTLAHDPGRTAKYLENAFNTQRAVVLRIIATAVRRELGA